MNPDIKSFAKIIGKSELGTRYKAIVSILREYHQVTCKYVHKYNVLSVSFYIL